MEVLFVVKFSFVEYFIGLVMYLVDLFHEFFSFIWEDFEEF